MTSMTSSRLRLLGAAAVLTAASLSAHAADWTYTLAPGSLIAGGTLAGSFSGVDADGDGDLSIAELVSFDVSYTGLPGVTTSFTIAGTPDAFGYDIADNELTFSVTDASSNSVSVNTYDGGSYSVLSATGPDGGTGALTISAVPEPSQLALMGGGLLALFGFTAARSRRSGAHR